MRKKNILLICVTTLLGVLCFCYVLNSKKPTIELPFSASDVEYIELYRFNVPASTQKKIVTSEDDIERIFKLLTSIAVQEDKLELLYGGTVTIFKFKLTNDTDFVIDYVSHRRSAGKISSCLFNYQTSANVGSIWNNFGENHQNVGEGELPTYQQAE